MQYNTEKELKDSRSPGDRVMNLSVLLAEDDDFQRKNLFRSLSRCGVQSIYEAEDGAEALQLLDVHKGSVDLILCDLDMPNMDGMEFIRHLGNRKLGAALVVTSGFDPMFLNSVESLCKAYGIEFLRILPKPITASDLNAALDWASKRPSTKPPEAIIESHGYSIGDILAGIASNQFEAFYQPKVDLRTGEVTSAEALARWRHPQAGIQTPYSFIDKLESAGQINGLTFQMIKQAAVACCEWRNLGLNIDVSVNLSLTSLTDTSIADQIDSVVRSAGLDPKHMTLEITETAALTDEAAALENLSRLRIRGFGLSIDDFGTGFSSMQQLSRIAFTELKIDRCFVSDMNDKLEARAIVESSVAVAQRLGLKSVSEGVENPLEYRLLKEAGCDLAQGYYISKPLPAAEFVEFAENYYESR